MTDKNNDSEYPIETHPFPPFVPENATLLMLGSSPPPPTRWKMHFYYPNVNNDMWRIFGLVFFHDKTYFLSDDQQSFNEALLREFLREKGVAMSDTGYQVRRLQGNASDKFLQIVTPIDLEAILAQLPHCRTLMTTGQLACETLLTLMPDGDTLTAPKIGQYVTAQWHDRTLRLYRMPSSSRAYPLSLNKKAAIYARFFADIGLL